MEHFLTIFVVSGDPNSSRHGEFVERLTLPPTYGKSD